MSSELVLFILAAYFSVLIAIALVTGGGSTTDTFFTANRQSPWYLVAFGMIGASLSGVTFISVPGSVAQAGFSYFQVVLGYLVGYWVIIQLLMPLYYRLELTSIYAYLGDRFGSITHKTGALIFLISRTLGSSLRLFLAANVLHTFLFQQWNVPFYITVVLTVALIWVYTFRGGIKTIVWTDTFQTTFLILAALASVVVIAHRLELPFGKLVELVDQSAYVRILHFDDFNSRHFFPKQFFGGIFIAIAMTGLDQDMMQKNLTCKTLSEAQKNMFWFSLTLVAINFLFLTLGALLYLYCDRYGIAAPSSGDDLFPMLALGPLGATAGVFFLLGITASAYASSDSALAALTTSFCIDFLSFKNKTESEKRVQKNITHLAFSVLFLVIILIFEAINGAALIDAVLMVASYTYGPLLGLFAFGLFTRRPVREVWTPAICALSPAISYALVRYAPQLWGGYQVGFETLIFNGLLTFVGLWVVSKKSTAPAQVSSFSGSQNTKSKFST